MSRPGPPPGDLLNLPLGDSTDPSLAPVNPLEAQDLLPFDAAEQGDLADSQIAQPPRHFESASFGSRLGAGLLDLASVTGALLLAAVGSWLLGAGVDTAAAPALLVFAASFSFLYTIVPLTFWGQTPGMAAIGLVARARNDVPLTIQQSVLRWAGALLTILLCGLPVILMITGRSLPDRLSGSRVSLL